MKINLSTLDQALTSVKNYKNIIVGFSGGIDSTVITYLASQYIDNITSYTINFDEDSEDLKMARLLSERNGINLSLPPLPITWTEPLDKSTLCMFKLINSLILIPVAYKVYNIALSLISIGLNSFGAS